MNAVNPYISCPILDSERFLLRLVEEGDTENLLTCYSDKDSLKLFNRDNCPIDFYYETQDAMLKQIKFWLWEYSEGGYVRFAIVDKLNDKAIGTIEIFAKKETFEAYGKIGVLRLDLASAYETSAALTDIIQLVMSTFGELFGIDSLITKANPHATLRVEVLTALDFQILEDQQVTPYADYFIRKM